MHVVRKILMAGAALAILAVAPPAGAQKNGIVDREDYELLPMPPGFHVEATELDGPVFADAQGRTLYRWPLKDLRNGDAGEQKNKPICDDHKYTESSGLMSPYPGGYTLPDIETRPSCAQIWPPVLADKNAKPVGKWTVVDRPDGRKQWAYDSYALYTSVLDHRAGDVNGGTKRSAKADASAVREPVGPPPNIPQQFAVYQVALGRMVVNSAGFAVYSSDKDAPNKSNCDAACLKDWAPVQAPEFAQGRGDLGIIERSPGIKQWTFRKMPLYTHVGDERQHSFEGSDVPGWHNVFTQTAPPPPKGFTVQDTRSGQVLADARGRTIYTYICGDDGIDQLACDHPDTTQAYRFAIGGDPAKGQAAFPYVMADKDAKSDSRTWSIMDIDPKTGHRAKPGQTDSVHVWAYRDRPVFVFSGDHKAGDIEGDAWGEFNGWRDGFKAFWLRDDFGENAS